MTEQAAAQEATFSAIDEYFEPQGIGRIETKWADQLAGCTVDGDPGPLVSTYMGRDIQFWVSVNGEGRIVGIEGPSSPLPVRKRNSLGDEPLGLEIRRAASQLP